jgi:O-antigen/teichoic acid export membrane protein
LRLRRTAAPARLPLFQMTPQEAPTHREVAKSILARNTLWNYIGFAVNLVTNLVLFPFVVAKVGEVAAGLWLLLGSVTGYMGLLELGIVPALAQRVASALARDARDEVLQATSTAVAVLAVMAVIAVQTVWFVPGLVTILTVPAEFHHTAVAVFVIAVAGFALKMPLAVPQALLLGSQRQDRCNHLWIVQAVAKALSTALVLILGLGVLAVVAVEALVPLLTCPLQLRWVSAELPYLRLSWRKVSPALARALVSFGGSLAGMSVCSLIIEQTDRLVVGAFRPIADVTHYSAAWKLYVLAYAFPTIILQAVSPLAASFYGCDDTDGLRKLLLRMTKYSAAVALPLTVTLGLTAGTLLHFWMGPGFVDARGVVGVLAAGFAVTSFNHAGYAVLVGTRQIAPTLWIYFIPQAALNLALSLWLVHPLGIVGVALGTAIPAVVLEYPFLRYLLRRFDLRWREFLSAAVRPAVLPALAAFLPLVVVVTTAGPVSGALLIAASACGLFYVGLFWTFSLDNLERHDLIGLARRRLVAADPEVSADG